MKKKTLMSFLMLITIIALLFMVTSCGTSVSEKADLVLRNGIIYSADSADTVYESLAVRDGKILFAGTDANVEAYIGSTTTVMDLEGKMVIPGMMDTHLHAPGTALTDLFNISLYGILTEGSTMAAIREFIAEHPDLDIYYGAGFSIGAFSGDEVTFGPSKERLDEICPDKPVIIRSYDGHILWANSKAFEQFGITAETPNPPGGVIEKDPATGALWGTLKEAAMDLIPDQEFTFEQKLEALKTFQELLHSLGYTGILSISGGSPVPLEQYRALEQAGELKLRVNASMTLDPEGDLASQFAGLKGLKETYETELLKVTTAKFFADGVIEGVTGYLLEPYTEEAGKGGEHYGELLWDPEKMREAFRMANSEGFQIHVHSIGDAATRNVLNALEAIRGLVPEGDYRNTITHLQLVDPADIPRFKELDVVASTQPYWHLKEPEWWEVVDYPLLGERAEFEYPLQSFFREGVVLVSSSDHPVTPIPNPLWAIETGVTRNLNNADYYGVDDITDMDDPAWLLNRDERASLTDMIKSYTANSAFVTFREEIVGTIAVGKYADLVVLGQNLFEIDPLDIDSVPVLMTIFNGEIVYEAGN